MAINPSTKYTGRITAPSVAYPYGKAQNVTVPGDGTGTPWEAALLNDIFGFQQALLSDAGIVPSGSPDKVGASQYLKSLFRSSGLVRDNYAALRLVTSNELSDKTSCLITAPGVDGFFALDKTDTTTADNGGLTIVDADGGRWKRRYAGNINLSWFETNADGIGNDSPAIVKAINVFPQQGGVLDVNAGVYAMFDSVHVNKPILFNCEGDFDHTAAVNSTGTSLVTFKWTGVADGTMFVFSDSPAADMLIGTTTGIILFGGGIIGASLNGASSAGIGVWAASTNKAKFHIQVSRFVDAGIVVDGGNAALSVRNEFDVHVVHGASAATYPMTGIRFRRFNGEPSTQNKLLSVNGLIYNGDLIEFEDTDNNICHHIHGVTQSGGTGHAIRFANGVTNHSRFNVIFYLAGDVKAESSTYGNAIHNWTSEGASMSIDSGGQLHYQTNDYVNAESFRTHEYKMSDDYHISSTELKPDGLVATSAVFAGNLWPCIDFPEAESGYANISIPPISNWNDGNIIAISFVFTASGVSAGNTVFRMRGKTTANLGGLATPSVDENAIVTVNATVNVQNIRKVILGTALTYNRGDSVSLRIDRLPANVDDTHTDDIKLLGIILHYESDGPNSGGSGPYDVPPPFI